MVQYEKSLSRTLGALADDNRREILMRLSRSPASATDLADPLGLTVTGLLKHVRVLEEAGLVVTQKNGRTRECRLGPSRLEDVSKWVDVYRQKWEGRLDRLESHLAKRKRGKL